MLQIEGIFEIAIRVKDLSRAQTFYRDILGFEEGMRDEQRRWLFMWVGTRSGMIVLQEDKGEWPAQHFAFKITSANLELAATHLRERDITVSQPVHHGGMGGISVYFDDPDGNQLELYAPIET